MKELRDIQLLSGGKQSLQGQLYHAIRQRILSGRYASGLRLPASRHMAAELGISRNTVLIALAQLEDEGYILSKVGAGTFVTDSIPDQFTHSSAIPQSQSTLTDIKPVLPLEDLKSNSFFATGIPDLEAFPMAIWRKLLRLHSDRTALMAYHSNQGYAPLRQAIAHYLRTSRACLCHSEQIIITDGAQQAISLTAQVLLKNKETVYVENPGYIRARHAFEARGCLLQGLDVDEQGIITSQLPKKSQARLLCLTPTHQYPLGGVLSLQRRMEVMSWMEKNKVWLLEDDYDSEFHFYQKPIAAMQGLGLANQTIYMGSFSKVIFPALRLGYLLVPESMVEKFVTAKSHMSGETNLLEQAITADFISEGHFNRHLLRMRKRYEVKLRLLLSLSQNISSVRAITPGAGMHAVLLFDQTKLNYDVCFANKMLQHGINANPLSEYYLGKAKHQGLVLGFANASEEQIVEGMELIKQLSKTRSKKT